jgi:ubiquitin-activating enzyme E1
MIIANTEQLRKCFVHIFSCFSESDNIGLIIADTRGLYAQIFNDFGEKFVVYDVNGEEPISAMIASITQDADGGLVATLDEVRHGFESGDVVKFSEVEGMTELNGTSHQITVISIN